MKVTLGLAPHNDPTLLEQIPIDVCSGYAPVWSEAYPDELAEPTRVVVSLRLRISESFEDRVRL